MTIKEIQPKDTWKIRQMVMWPEKPLEFVKLEQDLSGYHNGVFEGEELATVVSCFVEKEEMQFRKLATLPGKQKRGYASALLNYILEDAEKKGIKRVWCNARANKMGFYEKFGFTVTEERFSKEGIDYIIMERIFS